MPWKSGDLSLLILFFSFFWTFSFCFIHVLIFDQDVNLSNKFSWDFLNWNCIEFIHQCMYMQDLPIYLGGLWFFFTNVLQFQEHRSEVNSLSCVWLFVRLLSPWNSGKSTGVGWHFLLHQNTDAACILCLKLKYLFWLWLLYQCGEGNGNPFQYSCLENPVDRKAWWATIYGVRGRHNWSNLASYINEIRRPLGWSGFNTLVPT